MTVGIAIRKRNINKTRKIYAYLAAAKLEGLDAFCFNMKDVNFNKRKIKGYTYENGKYIKKEHDFPDIVHNISNITKDFEKEKFKRLTSDVPYTVKYVGNKWSVYNKLKKHLSASEGLIETYQINNIYLTIKYIDSIKKCVIKPKKGSKGRNIYFITKEESKYIVKKESEEYTLNLAELKRFLNEFINENYLIQKFINSKTKDGNFYDIRMYMQKIKKKKWVISYAYARIAKCNLMTSNIHKGASAERLTRFLINEFGNLNLLKKIEKYSLKVIRLIDKESRYNLNELGLDLGIDDNKKIWIFEINSRPGFPTISRGDITAARNTMKYIKSVGD